MKKNLIILLLILIGIAAFSWYRLHPDSSNEQLLTLYGNIDIREAQLTFNASEHVDRVLVEEGEQVQTGQLLATLHQALIKAQVDQARALLQASTQQLLKLQSGSRKEEIDRARAELQAGTATSKSSHDTWQRLERLSKNNLVSPETVETAHETANAAAARVKVAEATLQLLVIGPRVEDIAVAQAEVEGARAALTLMKENLAHTELHAPADGVIRTRILEPGDMANPAKPAITFAYTDPVWVRAYLPETLLGKVKLGMQVSITTDSYPHKQYPGWVGYISPTAEFTPKNVETPELRTRLVYQLRVYACNPNDELRLGMPATVDLDLSTAGSGQAAPGCSK